MTRYDRVVKISQRSQNSMLLSGSTIGTGWSVFSLLLGSAFTVIAGLLARAEYRQSNWISAIMLMFGVGLGFVLVGVGIWGLTTRESLRLDKSSQRGLYRVENILGLPTTKSFEFALDRCDHVELGRRTESRPGNQGGPRQQVEVYTADLRILAGRGHGKRSVKLDQTENGREPRVAEVAREVSLFLEIDLKRDDAASPDA
jgi:hypothetical protein